MSNNAVDTVSKYFDYLPSWGTALQERLLDQNTTESESWEKKIAFWRMRGLEAPNEVTSGVRNLSEQILKALTPGYKVKYGHKRDGKHFFNLDERIEKAFDNNVITKSQETWFNTIRATGNKGTHAGTAPVDKCEESLKCFEDLLRSLLSQLNITNEFSKNVPANTSEKMLYSYEDLLNDAELAETLTGNTGLVKKAAEAEANIAKHAEEAKELRNQIDSLENTLKVAGEHQEALGEDVEFLNGLLNKLLAQLKESEPVVAAKYEDAVFDREKAKKEIEEVLSEKDFIRMLLGEGSGATDEQLRAIAFPQDKTSAMRFLSIKGEGGTGKSLCLVAKLVRYLQDAADAGSPKRCLFVTYNKPLAASMLKLISSFSEPEGIVDVVGYDMLVNSLAKAASDLNDEYYKRFAGYANDVRYDAGWSIAYRESKKALCAAMEDVAQIHPEQSREYYLDPQNASWVSDEIGWLEERYADPDDAQRRYAEGMDGRVGRGGDRRPSSKMREVIVEIWRQQQALLAESNRYTIAQATRKLMESAELPQYDVIAVDEVQDFSLLRLQFLAQLRRDENAFMYFAGDEGQKLYQRDFTWSELDEQVRGYTITLHKNLRNSPSIKCFADRLLGRESTYDEARGDVHVLQVECQGQMLSAAQDFAKDPKATTVIIIGGNREDYRSWGKLTKEAQVQHVGDADDESNLLFASPREVKGLEFDNVVVDCSAYNMEDEEDLKNLMYVHFTRARKKLYVCYKGTPPLLLRKLYGDFLEA